MTLKIVSTLALVFAALTLIPYCAHLFALPNKIGVSAQDYFTAQRAYDGRWLASLALIPAMLLAIALAAMLRGQGAAFILAILAAVLMAATLPIFLIVTQPGNAQTSNWTVIPENWQALRSAWEYSHATNAILVFASFCLMSAAVVLSDKTV